MQYKYFQRLQSYKNPVSLGVVTDTLFWFCYWPDLDQPTNLFAEGSKGIQIVGHSKNVICPPDTKHLSFYPDALYPAELAVGNRVINLSPEEIEVYRKAYDDAVASFPITHSIHDTRHDVHFFKHYDKKLNAQKPEVYVAELSLEEAHDIAHGKVDEKRLRKSKTFYHITHGHKLERN